MTTIVWRDGVIAADTACVYGGSMIDGVYKIVSGPDGVLAGAAGLASYNSKFLAWVSGGMDGDAPEPKQDDDYMDRGAVFFPDGRVEVHEPDGVLIIRPKYYAFGSGKSEALGALFAGATAIEAVKAAIEHDPNTGGRVRWIDSKSGFHSQ